MMGHVWMIAVILLVPLLAGGCGPRGEAASQPAHNTLTEDEVAQGWELLFDGTDLSKWRGFRQEEPPAGWTVRDGAIRFDADHGGEGAGDLVTREQFADFELQLEWKISPGGNSGVFFRVSEESEQEFHSGPEVQIIDGSPEHYPDLQDTQRVGANYGLHPATRDVVKPVGEWNHLRLVVDGAHVEHWLNGEKVVEYELWTDEWKAMVAQTKFAAWPEYGMNRTGHICLQDHGSPVWFRNLKVRRLSRNQ